MPRRARRSTQPLERLVVVTIFGPACPTRPSNQVVRGVRLLEPQPLAADVSTLGEAISAYADAFQVRVTPYDGSYEEVPFTPGEEPKFFVHEDNTGTSMLV